MLGKKLLKENPAENSCRIFILTCYKEDSEVLKNGQGLGKHTVEYYCAMSTAFPLKTVQVIKVTGLERQGVTKGSLWQKRNLLFRNKEEGQKVCFQISTWAEAKDNEGRTYLLYEAKNPSFRGLVIQPFSSFYCFEVFPVEGSGK